MASRSSPRTGFQVFGGVSSRYFTRCHSGNLAYHTSASSKRRALRAASTSSAKGLSMSRKQADIVSSAHVGRLSSPAATQPS